jgi:SPP1 family phage portal protein
MKKDDEGKWIKGGAEFLTASNSTESTKLETETIKGLIFSISQTPDLSFDNVKALGNVSGVALKLLFLDAIIKALMNEGENRTMYERIANIMLSGISNTTNTMMSKLAAALYFDIIFNSIIPSDIQSATDIIINLKEAGLMSRETSIKLIDMVEDPSAELALIEEEKKATNPELGNQL